MWAKIRLMLLRPWYNSTDYLNFQPVSPSVAFGSVDTLIRSAA